MNQASDTSSRPSPKIKFGTIRSDGYRFSSYTRCRRTGKINQIWLSPEAWARRMAKKKAYDKANSRHRTEKMREYRAARPELYQATTRAYQKRTKEKFTAYQKQWVEKNRDKVRARLRKWDAEMRATRPDYRLKRAMRGRIYLALRGIRKLGSTVKLLGCDLETLRNWLESQFVDGMSWENYGPVWHVDHVVPISWFDLSCEESQKRAFNYKNLQPLFAEENCKKGNRYAGKR